AWLAILLGMGGGVILFFIYYFLFRQYPNLTLTGYTREVFGKYLGWIIGLLYVVFFIYASARTLRDFGGLMLSSTLPQTPLLAINLSFVLVMCYVLYLGIEVVGRTAEVFIVILFLLGIVGNFLVLVSGHVDLHYLQPFLEDGWKPILTTAFPLATFLPFGEMLVFTFLLPYLNRPELAKTTWLSALILSGLILSYTTSLDIAVLSVKEVERATFPLLSTIGRVELLEFIQRLDAIVVFTFLITVFFKVSIFFYSAVMGMVDLFKLENPQQIILPSGVIVFFLSMSVASNSAEHIEEGFNIANYYLSLPFFLIIPLVMLFITIIRNYFNKRKLKSKVT
ncbi:spore germination protein, partial [Strepomyces sp. STD 3.1]|nr:spore germination protein [Streptomyces sp. STD 3.1]